MEQSLLEIEVITATGTKRRLGRGRPRLSFGWSAAFGAPRHQTQTGKKKSSLMLQCLSLLVYGLFRASSGTHRGPLFSTKSVPNPNHDVRVHSADAVTAPCAQINVTIPPWALAAPLELL
jgi:hypothetical protein